MQPKKFNRRKKLQFAWPFSGLPSDLYFDGMCYILGATEGYSVTLILREQNLVSVPWHSPDSSETKALEFSLSFVTLIVL